MGILRASVAVCVGLVRCLLLFAGYREAEHRPPQACKVRKLRGSPRSLQQPLLFVDVSPAKSQAPHETQ